MNPVNNYRSKTVVFTIFYASLICLILYLSFAQKAPEAGNEENGSISFSDRAFDHLPIIAKAVYVYDISLGQALYEKNAHIPLPLASVVKVMTALCALETLGEEGRIT